MYIIAAFTGLILFTSGVSASTIAARGCPGIGLEFPNSSKIELVLLGGSRLGTADFTESMEIGYRPQSLDRNGRYPMIDAGTGPLILIEINSEQIQNVRIDLPDLAQLLAQDKADIVLGCDQETKMINRAEVTFKVVTN